MEYSLAELVARLADEPTVPNRDAFYSTLLGSRVSFAVGSLNPNMVGDHVVKNPDQMSIPTAPGPNGTAMLVVFSDRDSAIALKAGATFAEIDGRTLLQIALSNKASVIVQSLYQGKPSWSGVSPEHVATLLDE